MPQLHRPYTTRHLRSEKQIFRSKALYKALTDAESFGSLHRQHLPSRACYSLGSPYDGDDGDDGHDDVC